MLSKSTRVYDDQGDSELTTDFFVFMNPTRTIAWIPESYLTVCGSSIFGYLLQPTDGRRLHL
jgi:hypothetical protein